ncbi:Flp family type IVb pilin [Catenuloplanes atrovinosus]|uniref:Pilus assembly protein Flp/PilA n=1 Tax=Catenuloplanes atrovinosus TaxID=137266 RepID=A0AAE4CCU9_9ACTN|nr:Flp family type IVb pilin [Catenuloplanes atrovinosus]MDR7280001.1 pilus assembly protein Flp/PilA [Catenuloplanes atrovinosus]
MLNLYLRAAVLVADRLNASRRDRGATAVEYALIIAGVAAVLAVLVFALESLLSDMFRDTCTSIATPDAPAPAECAP